MPSSFLPLTLTIFTLTTSLFYQLTTPFSPSPYCPPFPYPFSTTLGYGHPFFHLTCNTSSSSLSPLLKINHITFSLLHFNPTTFTLTLSPHPKKSLKCPLHFDYIPLLPLNFTNTPFVKVSDSTCSRISLIKPCSNNVNEKCDCSWECALFNRPFRLVERVCETGGARIEEQGCHSDVLGYLDNVLKMGILVEFDGNNDEYFSRCKECKLLEKGECGYNATDPQKPFLCIVVNVAPPLNSTTASATLEWIRSHKARFKAASVVLVMICLLSVSVLVYIVVQSKRIRNIASLEDPTTTFLHRHRCASLLPPVFTYEELEASTNRFDPNRKIGDGGFGSVFLGHLFDGRVVAVKYLHRNHNHQTGVGGITVSSKSFCNEILILSSIEHANLVKLHGYCSDPRGLLLVYDYIPNGTLADHLHGPNRKVSGSLSWQTRVDIALQVAIAVEYLHFMVQPPVVHRDITTSNIFVDESMTVRVGDFGLSRLLVCSENRNLSGELSGSSSGCVWTGPQGTPGYLDPDYYNSFRLTEKSDVYSFGVVLLELITGLKAVDQRREKREVTLVDMVVSKIQLGLLDQVVDPVLASEGTVVEESVAAVAELAFQCVAADKDDRPDAKEVVAELRRIWNRTRGVRGSNANVVVVPAGTGAET